MNEEQIKNLELKLKHANKRKTPNYALYSYELDGCIITAYQSKKVLFQGKNEDEIIALLNEETIHKPTNTFPQAGSDEVGTGDYFGGVVVCACYVDEKAYEQLKHLGIGDSKTIKDDKIMEIAPTLMQLLPYSLLIVDNEKYNQIQPTTNMVDMKCQLHNQAYVHLRNKIKQLPPLSVVDQFVQAKSYYRYLQNKSDVVRNLHFETKAESKYFAVACASIIARYAFLKQMESLETKYNFKFHKGAGKQVDECIKSFVAEFGLEELTKVAKLHFKNSEKALKKNLTL